MADAIAEHIEKLILEGVLRPGEKLAPERELALTLDVSRPTLRDALTRLAERGLLKTTSGGTYVAQFLAPLLEPFASLLGANPRGTDDYFEFRRCMEAEAARLAALRATAVDKQAIRQCAERMTKAHALDDPTEETEADFELHVLIYEASHNVVLLHVMRALAEMLRANIFYSRQQLYSRPEIRDRLLAQHLALADAILAGKAEGARDAAGDHIRFTFETVEGIRKDRQRIESSLQRVSRADFLARKS